MMFTLGIQYFVIYISVVKIGEFQTQDHKKILQVTRYGLPEDAKKRPKSETCSGEGVEDPVVVQAIKGANELELLKSVGGKRRERAKNNL